jgi:hypothetical protein
MLAVKLKTQKQLAKTGVENEDKQIQSKGWSTNDMEEIQDKDDCLLGCCAV